MNQGETNLRGEGEPFALSPGDALLHTRHSDPRVLALCQTHLGRKAGRKHNNTAPSNVWRKIEAIYDKWRPSEDPVKTQSDGKIMKKWKKLQKKILKMWKNYFENYEKIVMFLYQVEQFVDALQSFFFGQQATDTQRCLKFHVFPHG